MARGDINGDPGTWETARELGRQLTFPTGPYEARVPTADEMNAVLPYIMDRMSRFTADKYFCENAELTLAHILGINIPRYGFPDSTGFNNNQRHVRGGRNWEGFDKNGLDEYGFNKEGFSRYGFDKEGYNKEGYNERGLDRDGFNKAGLDRNGFTREDGVKQLIAAWSPEYTALIAAQVTQLKVTLEAAADAVGTVAAAAPTKATKKTVAKKVTTAKKAAPKKAAAAPAVKKAAKKVVTAAPRNPFTDVAPRRRDFIAVA